MKLLPIFATILAVVTSYPSIKTWTLNELSDVIEKSEGDPEMMKYYINALNIIMYALFTGQNEEAVHANILSPSGSKKWTINDLKTALDDPKLSQALRPFYERSYHYLINNKPEGTEDEVEVVVPALDISTWTLRDISDALEDPDINSALISHLEKAKRKIMEEHRKNVTMLTPVGLIKQYIDSDEVKPTIVAKILSDLDKSVPTILTLW